MRFGISVPVRGQAAFLPMALRSILAQSTPVQLAVLDASPDDDAQRVLSASPLPIAYGYHHPDSGQAAAIQNGWDHTMGEIVAWLNADDYYFPDALARVAEVFRARPEVDVVYGHGVHVSTDGEFLTYFPAIDPDASRLTQWCVVCQPACFVRRLAMERVGGLDPRLHYTMDWDFWVRLLRAGARFHFLDRPLAVVRVHAATKTLRGGSARRREIDGLLRTTGTPWWRRLEIEAGFYRYDLRYRRPGPVEVATYWTLGALARVRARARREPRRVVEGLECWTNRVEDECLVALPWYRMEPATTVTFATNRAEAPSLRVANEPVTVERAGVGRREFLGERTTGHVFRASFPPSRSPLLSFRLAARAAAWRLLSLAVG